MRIDLTRIFAGESQPVKIDYEFSLKDVEIDGSFPFISPIKVTGTVRPFAGAAEFTADVEYDFSKPCDRCAEETEKHFHQKVSHTVVAELNNEEDDDSYIQVDNAELDVDELIYSDIILDMPVKYLCKEDCLGICPTCGANLNKGDCNCGNNQVDPRMEILRKLIENND